MPKDRERVTKALDALTTGLFPYVESAMKEVYQTKWHDAALGSFRGDRGQGKLKGDAVHWDAHALLTVMWDQWNRVFRHRLGQTERSLISELREFRNQWAHQVDFSFDDTYRILDSVGRLLQATGAPETAKIAREKHDLMRYHYGQEARAAYRKSQITKRKWQDFAIYLVCCMSLVFVILQYFGAQYWFFVSFVVLVFVHLTYQRIVAPPPLYFGPHECSTCGKIIYGENCPYCELPSPSLASPRVAT